MSGRGLTRRGLVALALASFALPGAARAQTGYDVVIRGGRVVDPETGLDAVRDVAVSGGRIVAVSEERLAGRRIVDATGLVVAPGFVDLHSHASEPSSWWMQAFDGVTTALELEAGAWPVDKAYADAAAKRPPINYGFAAGWMFARSAMFGDADRLIGEAGVEQMVGAMRTGLAQGALGIGVLAGYAPNSDRAEYYEIARLAASAGAPVFTHLRFKNTYEPRAVLEGLEELIAVSATTGATMHICHLNSSALRETPRATAIVAAAQSRGIRVTTEGYPWGAGMTMVKAPFLAPDNLALVGLRPSDIEIVQTGERPADAARLAEMRKTAPESVAVIHYLHEEKSADRDMIARAVLLPGGMIASDAGDYFRGAFRGATVITDEWPLPAAAAGHPRTGGTFTQVLGKWVRDEKRLGLVDAISRASLLPARLLESYVPAMRRKGRLRAGMDADIVVFDPATVAARADYRVPGRAAAGMRYVMVGGRLLIDGGRLDTQVRAGSAIRNPRQPQADQGSAR